MKLRFAFSILLFASTGVTAQTNTFPATGRVGVGTMAPTTKMQVLTSGADINSGNGYQTMVEGLSIAALTGGRSATLGAQLEFVIPANTDGNNLWGQGRIITVAGNAATNNAVGKMIIGTRRRLDKLGTGVEWYYGNDLVIDGVGNIGVNTLTPTEKLSVNGNIRAKEIKVETANWPDYVFADDYKLPDLKETEAFIRENKYLPGMPSAAMVEAEGMSLGEMNRKMLEKVEELTLFIVEQNKRLEYLEEFIKNNVSNN